jgi:SAM-dependent methyltransferase
MPTSPFSMLTPLMKIILEIHPRPARVLDVGIGYGKYGLLCREYLMYWNSPSPRQVTVDGIEVFPEYITQLQKQIYDTIFIGDAARVLLQLPDNSYDLALLIDVLEHFDKQQGVQVVRECQRVAKVVIVSTPRKFWHQKNAWGNPYETHQSLWSKEDLRRLGAIYIQKAENWIAVFAKPPYDRSFRFVERVRRWGYRWIPDWFYPYARWAWKIALKIGKQKVQ